MSIELSTSEEIAAYNVYAGRATIAGDTISIADTLTGITAFVNYETAAVEGARMRVSADLSVPSGSPDVGVRIWAYFKDASGTSISSSTPSESATLVAGEAAHTFTVDLVAPAGTAIIRTGIDLTDPTTGTSREVVFDSVILALAAAEEIIAATLERDLNRMADTANTGATVVEQGVVGTRSGQITYLCSDDQLDALDAVYQSDGPVSLASYDALDGFVHYATGKLRMTAEKAVPGNPSKWLVQAEVKGA